MTALRSLACLAVALGLAACATKQAAPPAEASRPRPGATRVAVATAPAFVAENGSIDLFVIRSSELALQRSSSPRIRDFANRMIEGHKGTSSQLSLAGRRLNLLPSAVLWPAHQAMLDSLANSTSFDADFVRDQRLLHQRQIQLDSAFASLGQSPTLRPVAAAALEIEERHLRLLAYL